MQGLTSFLVPEELDAQAVGREEGQVRRLWKRKGREAEEEEDRREDRVSMDGCAGCALLKVPGQVICMS